MNTVSPDVPSSRIVMFGLQCAFTDAVAAGLVERGLPPLALIIQGHPNLERPVHVGTQRSRLPIAGTQPTNVAREYPTFQIGNLTSLPTLELIESFRPDVIVVACFLSLIPYAIRDIPRWTAINIHPSLLPAHRGPDPLFWIMRDGGAGCGVTVHEMSSRFDAGDILAQRAIPYPQGTREHNLERLLARAGAELVSEIITSRTSGGPHRRAQDESAATYESWPDASDYLISVDRPVRDAWNFIRGVSGRGVPVRIETGSGVLCVSDATDYQTSSAPPAMLNDGEIVIEFLGGWLLARAYELRSR